MLGDAVERQQRQRWHGGGAASDPDDENSQDKIIVRSNGTVTYVGKDIAYQLWKFGLLGKDFHYARWKNAPEGETVWATTARKGEADAPHFGDPAAAVYNVIDSRQAYLQQVVAAGLKALGHPREAERSIHLSYEIVALTPRCAEELGYELSAEEAKKAYVEVSGRKGFGVKADDLIGQAGRRGAGGSDGAASGHGRCGADADGACDCDRGAAIFSAEVYARVDYRV